jgi:ParB family chromosome partitioning protein
MSAKRSGLGRNLTALLNHRDREPFVTDDTSNPERFTLAAEALQPGKYQPRKDMDESALMELAESIKKQGLLQPLLVREIAANRYEIIAGERRWRACQIAGMTEVPVILRQVNDETAMAMALVENLQREDLNAMDQARAIHRLHEEFTLTHQQIAELLCKSRTAVSNFLRLLNLNFDVQRMVEHGDLDMGHARALLMLDKQQQTQAAQLIVAKSLSVRETEALVTRIQSNPSAQEKPADITSLFNEQLHALSQQLQTKIKLKQSKTGKGSLIIHYQDLQNLEDMLNQFKDILCHKKLVSQQKTEQETI